MDTPAPDLAHSVKASLIVPGNVGHCIVLLTLSPCYGTRTKTGLPGECPKGLDASSPTSAVPTGKTGAQTGDIHASVGDCFSTHFLAGARGKEVSVSFIPLRTPVGRAPYAKIRSG